MNFRRIKHTLLRLSAEERTIAAGSLMVIIGSLLPWYSMTFNFDEKNVIENGFTGDLGIIGFSVFLMTSLSGLFLLSKHFNLPLPHFKQKKDQIILFLMGESAFLILLSMAIYTKRSLDFTNAGVRFGLYTSLAGACLAVFAAYAQLQKEEKNEAEAFFGYPDNTKVAIKHETPSAQPKPIQEINEEAQLFEEVENKTETREENDNQRQYFMKEAGLEEKAEIKVNIEALAKKREPQSTQQKSSFYDDHQ